MEYALPSHNYHTTAELNGGDLFSMPLQQAAHDNVQQLQQAASAHNFAAEALPAESQLSPVLASLSAQQKSAQITQPMVSAQTGQKVKRQDDIWTGNLQIKVESSGRLFKNQN